MKSRIIFNVICCYDTKRYNRLFIPGYPMTEGGGVVHVDSYREEGYPVMF